MIKAWPSETQRIDFAFVVGHLAQRFGDFVDSERKQLNCCVDIYMKKCWRGPEGEEDLTDEIEEKMGELQLLDQQPNENDDEARQRRAVEKSNMALEIAMWYLGNAAQLSSKDPVHTLFTFNPLLNL